jgi:hypothetical protein
MTHFLSIKSYQIEIWRKLEFLGFFSNFKNRKEIRDMNEELIKWITHKVIYR